MTLQFFLIYVGFVTFITLRFKNNSFIFGIKVYRELLMHAAVECNNDLDGASYTPAICQGLAKEKTDKRQ